MPKAGCCNAGAVEFNGHPPRPGTVESDSRSPEPIGATAPGPACRRLDGRILLIQYKSCGPREAGSEWNARFGFTHDGNALLCFCPAQVASDAQTGG